MAKEKLRVFKLRTLFLLLISFIVFPLISSNCLGEEANKSNSLQGVWCSGGMGNDNIEYENTIVFWNDGTCLEIDFSGMITFYGKVNELDIEQLKKFLTNAKLVTPKVPVRKRNLANEFITKPDSFEYHFNGSTENMKTGNKMKVYYDRVGSVYYDGGWLNGQPDGNGKIYYASGVKWIEFETKNGQLEGKYLKYFMNGKLYSETNYRKGKAEGKNIIFYRNGKKDAEYMYHSGKKEGDFKLYYMNGHIKMKGIYKTPLFGLKETGIYGYGEEYYENGRPKYKGDYKKGLFNGKGTFYNNKGEIVYKGQFKNGDFIK